MAHAAAAKFSSLANKLIAWLHRHPPRLLIWACNATKRCAFQQADTARDKDVCPAYVAPNGAIFWEQPACTAKHKTCAWHFKHSGCGAMYHVVCRPWGLWHLCRGKHPSCQHCFRFASILTGLLPCTARCTIKYNHANR